VGQRGIVRAGDYNCFSVEKKQILWERDFFLHYRIVSAFKKVEFISNQSIYFTFQKPIYKAFLPHGYGNRQKV